MSTRFGKVLENVSKLQATDKLPKRTRSSASTTSRKVGRPPGKKSDPDYTQVTVYLRKENHLAAKKRLLDDAKEFSELVDELVAKWLRNSGSSKV